MGNNMYFVVEIKEKGEVLIKHYPLSFCNHKNFRK